MEDQEEDCFGKFKLELHATVAAVVAWPCRRQDAEPRYFGHRPGSQRQGTGEEVGKLI